MSPTPFFNRFAGGHDDEENTVRIHPGWAVPRFAVAAIIICLAAPAAAQDSDAITVNSKVSPFCAGLGTAAEPLALGDLIGADGRVTSSFSGPSTHSVPGYYCNGPATIELVAAPLIQADGVSVPLSDAEFTHRVDYVATLTWDDVAGMVASAANAPAGIPTTEANIGDLVIAVSGPTTDGDRRPIAGAYEGAVTLTVTLN